MAVLLAVVGYQWRGIYIIYSSAPLTFGCLNATLLATTACLRLISVRLGAGNAAAGTLCVWALLLAVLSLFIPGASYLPLWPLAGAALGLACAVLRWSTAYATGTLDEHHSGLGRRAPGYCCGPASCMACTPV